ncbi:unnamed protein product [Ostreobium quekettii]|uniref:Vacuolar protein-sorting-associated protein 25 n=1 Tax=Ostreobium quekettii TaxID=121088 RepID=A0A8S1IKH0_9CHLO|nr:unnamed protein product [Ostreobium quekettii]
MAAGGFTFPFFHEYPPYFTLQPVKETKDKQCQLWGALILSYCKHYKIYVLSADGAGDETALFKNDKINRKLNTEARRAFFDYLVVQGNGVWLDQSQQQFLVLWKKVCCHAMTGAHSPRQSNFVL